MNGKRKHNVAGGNLQTTPVQALNTPTTNANPTFNELIAEGIKDAENSVHRGPYTGKKTNSWKPFITTITVLLTLTLLALTGFFVYKTLKPTPEMILSSCWKVTGTSVVETRCETGAYTHVVENLQQNEEDCSKESNYAVLDVLPGSVACLKPVN